MRTAIIDILLILLLSHAATRRGLAADETYSGAEYKDLIVHAPRPEYPLSARTQRQAGAGVAILTVDPKTGVVTTVEIEESTGHRALDVAMLRAFRRWQFKPGTVAKARVPVIFLMGGTVQIMVKVRTVKDVDETLAPFLGRGTVLHAPQPRYPVRPPWTDKQGKGIYEMRVRKDGKVEDVRILKTSGDPTFDEITVSALRKWRLRNGPLIVELPLAFRLTPRSYDFWVAKR